MADNDNRCPLCGKNIDEEEAFCRDCREIAENAYPEGLLSHLEDDVIPDTVEDANTPDTAMGSPDEVVQAIGEDTPVEAEAPPVKSNKKLFIFVAAGLVFMILLCIFSIRSRDAEAAETAYWNKCIEENTPLGFSKYLVRYPDGQYSGEAQSKIVGLRENEQKEWQTLRNSKNVDALFAFLKDHPQTPYERQILHAIDSLSWIQTEKLDTKAAYQAYIDNVKIGRFSGEYEVLAQQKYDYLNQLKTIEGDELKEVKKALNGFFKALSSVNSKDIQKHSIPVLIRFYKSENQESAAIADSVRVHLKTAKIKSVSYSLPADLSDVIQDNKGIYFITTTVKSEKAFTDRKKKKEESQSVVNIELDSLKLVRSVYPELKKSVD